MHKPLTPLLLLLLSLFLWPQAARAQTPESAINIEKKLGDLEIEKTPAGYRVSVNGRPAMEGQELLAILYRQQEYRNTHGVLFKILNITSPIGIAWVVLGLAGQVCFSGRMLVQWISSEKAGRSVVPVAFWWMSLGGALMLLTYFTWRKDIVGVLGQSTGLFIYARNLHLIRRHQSNALEP